MLPFSTCAASLVGKAPTQAEFLRIPSSAPGFAAFDAWLTDATEWAHGRAGPEWPEAFAGGAIHAFVFRPPSADPDLVLCGALAPSRDRAGRQFPLAAVASLRVSPMLAESPQLLPFVLEAYWAKATEVLLDVVAASGGDIGAASAQLGEVPGSDVTEASQLYEQWTAELEVRELWSLLGPPLSDTDPSALLRVIAETVRPFAGKERPETPLSLRVPLGLAGGVAVCFWLDLLVRSLGWRSTIPSFFWSHDGERGHALVHLGQPPKVTLAELWLPRGRHDAVFDLSAPPSAAWLETLPPASADVLSLLATPGAKVNDLLRALRPGA